MVLRDTSFLSNGSRQQLMPNFIKDLLGSTDKKFLVFAHHKVMMEEIVKVVEEAKVGFIFIDGSMSCEARKVRVDTFQTVDSCKVSSDWLTIMILRLRC